MVTLRQIGSEAQHSKAWELGIPEVVRFITDEGICFGLLWHALQFGALFPLENKLILQYGLGNVIITGPKLAQFWHDFVQKKVVCVRADGSDILSVTVAVKQPQ